MRKTPLYLFSPLTSMLSRRLQECFEHMADILEFQGESVFKIRAYRNGARIVSGMSEEDLQSFSANQLKKLPGIGNAIAEKIVEYRQTGSINALEKAQKSLPDGLLDLLKIPGMGPKTLAMLWTEYQVTNISQLKQLLASGKLAEHFNFGEKKVENLRNGIQFFEEGERKIPYPEAKILADQILNDMKHCPSALNVEVAGSLRRKKPMIRDIDILVSSQSPKQVIEYFLALPMVDQVNAHGETKASVFTADHRQVDLRVVAPESFGSALQYFTGSKEHNILLRRVAQKHGLLLSEYGVFRGDQKLAGETEQEVYKILGQKWIEPEKRVGETEVVE